MDTFNDLTVGQEKAALQKLGGTKGVKAFLSGNLILTPAPEKSLEEKKQEAFSKSHKTALVLKDLMHGWGEYGSESGSEHFSVMCSNLADRARNAAQSAIRENHPLQYVSEMLNVIQKIEIAIAEFQVREGIKFEPHGLRLIKQGLKGDNCFYVFQGACALSAFLAGMEFVNNILLSPTDKIS